MNKELLTQEQIKLIDLISKEDLITDPFTLTGGTALTSFYISYRYSDDIDLFSTNEVNVEQIIVWFKKNKDLLGYDDLDYSNSYNRNLFFLDFGSGYSLKLEFTYYPFSEISKGQKYNKLSISSEIDIAVNKLFTIYQNPRIRDFTDLYELMKKNDYDIFDLISKAKVKFDWDINYIQLAKQMKKVSIHKDMPRFKAEYDLRPVSDHFNVLINKLADSKVQE